MKGKDFRKDLEHLESFLDLFRNKYDLSTSEILTLINQDKKTSSKRQIIIPLSIFITKKINSNLGYMESLIKFLKEYHNFKIKELSELFNLSEGSLWASYYKSKEKSDFIFNDLILPKLDTILQESLNKIFKNENFISSSKKVAQNYFFDLNSLLDKKYSLFQKIILILNTEHNLKNITIAKILDSKPQSVWNALNKVTSKNKVIFKDNNSQQQPNLKNDLYNSLLENSNITKKRGGRNHKGQ